MAKNQLATTSKPKRFRDVHEILQNPADRAKLQNYVDEAVRCKTKILDQQESIKTLKDSAVEAVGIEPKMFNTLVSLFFNNNFDQKKEEIEKIEMALEALMLNTSIGVKAQFADTEV